MSEPWYRDGLAFSCTMCGKCCTGSPGVVWVSREEIRAIAEYRKEPVEEFRACYTRAVDHRRSLREFSDGDCILYDRKVGCTVYPVRPVQCRAWPFWDSTAGTEAAWDETRRSCPGAGQGALIPAEEVTRRRSLRKM